MTNLTSIFKRAAEGNKDWTLEDARRFLQEIAVAYPDSDVDWEQGDEEWGRVICGDSVVGLLCAKIPIAILIGGHWSLNTQEGMTSQGIEVVC